MLKSILLSKASALTLTAVLLNSLLAPAWGMGADDNNNNDTSTHSKKCKLSNSKKDESENKHINNKEKKKVKSDDEIDDFSNLPKELKLIILEMAAYEIGRANKNGGKLASVCKNWSDLMKPEDRQKQVDHAQRLGKIKKAWFDGYYGITEHNKQIFDTFYNGTLIYKPEPESDEGKIELRIADLHNPLEGTFDLSECGDKSKYLSISTGCRKGMKAENKGKLEIWLTPRFMVEKKLKSSASHLQPIMDNWTEDTAPIGILWSWGGTG